MRHDACGKGGKLHGANNTNSRRGSLRDVGAYTIYKGRRRIRERKDTKKRFGMDPDRPSLVIQMIKHICVRASPENTSPSQLGQFSPVFLFLLKEFFLDVTEDNKKITPRCNLEVGDNQLDKLRLEFRFCLEALMEFVVERVKPKQVGATMTTDPMLAVESDKRSDESEIWALRLRLQDVNRKLEERCKNGEKDKDEMQNLAMKLLSSQMEKAERKIEDLERKNQELEAELITAKESKKKLLSKLEECTTRVRASFQEASDFLLEIRRDRERAREQEILAERFFPIPILKFLTCMLPRRFFFLLLKLDLVCFFDSSMLAWIGFTLMHWGGWGDPVIFWVYDETV
ncbi:uncharacterized protein LOC129305326 [Prosopis cineraria]|uniref:uncharacterized protein LOC129305326 n=1 Tax=Prosopis cineraria TaxID=364024 RepID=UPI00240FF3A6|nr:uncharacterized protein LOC129305326 [Prosopis cineraria]